MFLATLQDRHALPFCHVSLKAQKPNDIKYPQTLNTLGDHLRKKRLDLELLQKEVASQIGVDEITICNWEMQRTAPTLSHIPKVLGFLGYMPLTAHPESLGQKLVTFRRVRGVSQKAMARRLKVDPTTLARWERGERKPSRKLVKKVEALLAGF